MDKIDPEKVLVAVTVQPPDRNRAAAVLAETTLVLFSTISGSRPLPAGDVLGVLCVGAGVWAAELGRDADDVGALLRVAERDALAGAVVDGCVLPVCVALAAVRPFG